MQAAARTVLPGRQLARQTALLTARRQEGGVATLGGYAERRPQGCAPPALQPNFTIMRHIRFKWGGEVVVGIWNHKTYGEAAPGAGAASWPNWLAGRYICQRAPWVVLCGWCRTWWLPGLGPSAAEHPRRSAPGRSDGERGHAAAGADGEDSWRQGPVPGEAGEYAMPVSDCA